MASTRLPGKVLKRLGEHSALRHVLTRCLAIPGVDVVCCATTRGVDCDPVAEEARSCGAEVYRGSEGDVLGRHLEAAAGLQAGVVLRVTSDCPVIDPEVCGEVLQLRERTDASLACNNMPPSWPHGLDCEAVPVEWLERAALEARCSEEREHVTPFIREHPEARKANLMCPLDGMGRHRWTLDTPADLEFFRALFARLPRGRKAWGWRSVLSVVEAEPELATINVQDGPRGSRDDEWAAASTLNWVSERSER